MNFFIRKLKTAKRILVQQGLDEVFMLLIGNVELYLTRFARALFSRAKRAVRFLLPARKKNDLLPHILYVSEQLEVEAGQTVRYRIHNLRQALKGTSKTRFELIQNGVWKDRRAVEWADLIVLMRTEWSDHVGTFFDLANGLNKPVVFDIDDIIFLPDFLEKFLDVLPENLAKESANFRTKFARHEKTFRRADFATTSTPYIAGIMEREGKTAFVIHNGLNRRQLAIGEEFSKKQPARSLRKIGYLSGSVTHNKDFLQAAPAIERILSEYDDVRLQVVGFLDTSSLSEQALKRTDTACFMKWDRMLRKSAENYLNIAPLDISNPFCHAKSELKYFEAAIVGVPTVASPTDTFSRCIANGENGMLASTPEEWYDCLKALLDDRELYASVARNARQRTIAVYSPEAVAKEAMNTYQQIIDMYSKGGPR